MKGKEGETRSGPPPPPLSSSMRGEGEAWKRKPEKKRDRGRASLLRRSPPPLPPSTPCLSSLPPTKVIIITGTFILQNNAVPQHQRGAANGLSMTAMSVFKAVAPAAGGAIFSWAQKRQYASILPGDQMVFFVLNAVEFIGFLLTFFLVLPSM